MTWWNTSWERRQKLTLNTNGISLSGNVTRDLVILVKVDIGNTDFWANTESDGKDVRFVANDDSTLLEYHFEKFDHTGDDMFAWIKVTDTFNSSTDLEIFMYYGNSGASDAQNESSTYTADYEAVWHLQQTAGNILDSTSNNHDSDLVDLVAQGTAAGKINGACDFERGSTNFVRIPDSAGFAWGSGDSFSFAAWIKSESNPAATMDILRTLASDSNPIVTLNTGSPTSGKANFTIRSSDGEGSTSVEGATTVLDGAWHHIVAVRDVGADKIRIYVDGASDATEVTDASTGNFDSDDEYYIGIAQDEASEAFDGLIDEVKMMNIGLTADEIRIIYNSENDSLIAFGSQESFFTQSISGDAVTVAESLAKQPEKLLADEITVADATTKDFFKTLSEALTLVESIQKATVKTAFVDSIVINENLTASRLYFETLLEAITLSESLVKKPVKSLADSISIVESLVKIPMKSISDEITVVDATNKGFSKTISDAISIAELNTKLLNRTLTDVITVNESLSTLPGKTLSDSITVSETVTASPITFKTLTDSISIIENVSRELKKFLNEMQKDFDTILGDVPFARQVTWIRKTLVEDEMGRESSDSNEFSQVISIVMQSITERERSVLGLGVEVKGFKKAYVEHSYLTAGGNKSIKTGDFITDSKSIEFIVEKILSKRRGHGAEVFRKLILRRIGND